MNKISVALTAKNEERYIRDSLESVKWADEIVIVDDYSTDRTVEISRAYTKKVFLNDSKGAVNTNKNLAIETATGDWILSLDADEIVTEELKEEILATINSPSPEILGYNIPRKNYFLGKWIKTCGWYPHYSIRLFKKGTARGPSAIHDTLEIKEKSKVGFLKSPLIHCAYENLDEYFEKFNRFTSRLAQEEYDQGVRINTMNFPLYFFIKPLFWFLLKYFFWRGFCDGFRGLFISFSSALVIFTTYAKLWEKQIQC